MAITPWTALTAAQTDAESPLNQILMDALRTRGDHVEEWVGKDYTAAENHDHDGTNSKRVYTPGALVYNSGAQTTTHATEKVLTFPNETYDDASIHEGVTNPTRLSVPSGVTRVRLKGMVQWTGSALGNNRDLYIKKNGSYAATNGRNTKTPNSASLYQEVFSPILEVTGGTDYFELACSQDAGGNLDVTYAWFSMEIVG